jgi:hypothetical protein
MIGNSILSAPLKEDDHFALIHKNDILITTAKVFDGL